MTSKLFLRLLENACNSKTYYIKGGFGLVLNASGKKRAIEQYKYNADRADKINALDPHTFAFDCCGLIKGVYWGFVGDAKKTYGGAVYEANGLKDANESGLFKLCYHVSEDMTSILPGEFLYMKGHCGIYAGGGKVYESTPSGKCGAQVTDLNRVKWSAHGKLPFIEYEEAAEKPKQEAEFYIIQRGDTLSKIASRFGIKDWRTLWARNPQIINPNLIYPGQRIKIK